MTDNTPPQAIFLSRLQKFGRFLMRLLANVEITGMHHVPQEGPAIVVSNHVGRLDAMLGVLLVERSDIVFFIAEKYQKSALWRWFARNLNAVWLDREGTDFGAMRQVLKRLKAGELLGMAPEGTRSKSGALIAGKSGAAYLAAKAKAPIIPVALVGCEDAVVKSRLKRFQRLDINIVVGKPFTLAPLDRKNLDASLQARTDEIMCRIAALLPPEKRGVYANHPLLRELTPNH